MPAPALPEVDAAAREVADALLRGAASPDAIWQIKGVPGAGKSTCLARIAEILESESELAPVVVSPPAYHLDAGAGALTDVAVGLACHSVVNGEIAAWRESTGKW